MAADTPVARLQRLKGAAKQMSTWDTRLRHWRWISVTLLTLGVLGLLLAQPAEGVAGDAEIDATVECGVASTEFCSSTDSKFGVVAQGITGNKQRFALTLLPGNRPPGFRQDDQVCINVVGTRPDGGLNAYFVDYGLCNPEPVETPEPEEEEKEEDGEDSE
jgi:hypothetical protein